MTTLKDPTLTEAPVRKSITVKTGVEHAFRAFTEGIDDWWPRAHHIGKAPMKKIFIEGRDGGRCYTEQTDGTECDWGSVLVCDPPRRLVIAWQVTTAWGYEPDPAKSSEVEVRFEPQPGGVTRIDLEHRNLQRHGPGFEAIRNAVDSPDGWAGSLRLYAARAERPR